MKRVLLKEEKKIGENYFGRKLPYCCELTKQQPASDVLQAHQIVTFARRKHRLLKEKLFNLLKIRDS